jgi:hypothetical protein
MEYACTDNNKDMSDGHLQPGPFDGSLRDGTAIAPPPRPRRLPNSRREHLSDKPGCVSRVRAQDMLTMRMLFAVNNQ